MNDKIYQLIAKISKESEENAEHIKVLNEDSLKLADSQKEICEEIGKIKIDYIEVKTDVKWLKKFFWIIATASIGGLITGIIQLLIRK